MKLHIKPIAIACLLLSGIWVVHSQAKKIHQYYIYTNGDHETLRFDIESDLTRYAGADKGLESFFSRNKVSKFYQGFPDIPDAKIQSVYIMKTADAKLCERMLAQFPSYFYKAEELGAIELLYHPNDYGSTSPVANLGENISRFDLDYIDAPSAWDVTTGNSNVVIGISDTQVNDTYPDLVGKTSYVTGSSSGNGEHGTSVAILAAAQGDDAQGTVGVCYDCDVLAGNLGFNNIGDPPNFANANLYKMASEGAKVINMSWRSSSYVNNPADGFKQVEQDIINLCIQNFGTIFVAAAGNHSSFSTPTLYHDWDNNGLPDTVPGILHVFPASYENVISVSTVAASHPELNADSYWGSTPTISALYERVHDYAGQAIDGSDLNNPILVTGFNGYALSSMNTLNDRVDILAPSFRQLYYYRYVNNNPNGYTSPGTSFAAPMVAGTIGLMASIKDCITGEEAEDILQLTSKDVEHAPFNAPVFGMVGTGKLETGKAVHFVDEMQKINGKAVIEDHTFYRSEYHLNEFNNDLLIDNVSFIDSVTVSFTAKSAIELTEGTYLGPDQNGAIDLNIDPTIDVSCTALRGFTSNEELIEEESPTIEKDIVQVYPSPFDNQITIRALSAKAVMAEVYDMLGNVVYANNYLLDSQYQLDLKKLKRGIYILKLYDAAKELIHTQKIVKK